MHVETALESKERHPSLERLLTFAYGLSIDGPSALAAALNESDQTITNWRSRGVSQAGALKAQLKLGCNANWVLTGDGEMVPSIVVDFRANRQPMCSP